MRYAFFFLVLLAFSTSCKTPSHSTKPIKNNDSLKVERAIDKTLEKYFQNHLTSK
jgi:hypothetical protein